ncbi:MAG: Xaa-Pro peptidase family protein [Deltaproteobacteria bacterium]|nr:Xaa-Pro peptidase family protein [Deltaproteobacteria bacterium]
MTGNERLVNPISTAELNRRWDAVRAAMETLGLDALVMQNNNEFLGGYVKWFTDTPARNAYYQTVLFSRSAPMAVVRQGPMGGARDVPEGDLENRGIGRLLTNPSYTSVHYSGRYDAEQILSELKRRGHRRIGLVGTAGMSYDFCAHLQSGALPNASFVDATEMVDRLKALKSPEEQERIRRTAAMQDEIVALLAQRIRPGMKDFEVAALAQYEGQLRGSEQGIFLGSSAPLGSASQFVQRHFQGRELREGDHLTLLVENNGAGGFYTEIARTFVLGKASQELREGFELVREAQQHTLRLLKPGTPCREIFAAHNAFMRARGQAPETRLYAHGQGYDMVERPLLREDETQEIEAGMCIVVHPAFMKPSLFAIVCDNYFVTPDGPSECLHKTPQRIFEL